MRDKRFAHIRGFVVFVLVSSFVPAVSQAAVVGPSLRVHVTDSVTSLNSEMADTNYGVNRDVSHLRFAGFTYENSANELEPNTTFGSYRILSNSPFRVQYTVNTGRVWSDEVPITAVDLLLHHVICSSDYSDKTGLGNPKSSGVTPVFNSVCYSGQYDENISGVSLSTDKMSLTFEFKNFFPDWESVAPKPFPVHTLVLLSGGYTQLPDKTESIVAKDKFERAFLTSDRIMMSEYGKIWSNNYTYIVQL